jgi:two-component system nitrate/nitrite response regulator NarL
MNKLDLIIADDHTLIRMGLRNIILQMTNIKLVGEFDNGLDALNYILTNEPAIAILDIDMPELDGFEVCEKVRKEHLQTKIIFLTMLNEEAVFDNAQKIGANGFILKNFAMDELNQAIQSALDGEFYISKNLRDKLTNKPSKLLQNEKIKELIIKLTSTEKQILKLIAENYNSKQISEMLFSSELTVRKHRQNITNKLELTNEAYSLSKFAIQNRDYLI